MNEARPPLPERAAIDAALHRHAHPALDEEASWEWREWRWLALLPSQVFWVAPSLEGWARLEQEGELLGAAFHATGGLCPQVCFSDPQARLQVRTRIDGINGRDIERRVFGIADGALPDNRARYRSSARCTPWGETFAFDLGGTLARLHRAWRRDDLVARLVPSLVDWPAIEASVLAHVTDETVRRVLPRVRDWDTLRPSEPCALHFDPHLGNLLADAEGRLTGIIDLDSVALGDPLEDLRYLHSYGLRYAARAMDGYDLASSASLDRARVGRFHVRSAFEEFAWVTPESPRFPHIVGWARAAAEALTPEWA